MEKLTPTQEQILRDLAAGGYVSNGLNGYTLFPEDRPWYTVRYATWLRLYRAGFIARVPDRYPYRYRISAAGIAYAVTLSAPQEAPHV